MNIPCGWDDGKGISKSEMVKKVDIEGECLPVSQYGDVTEDEDEVAGNDNEATGDDEDEDDMARLRCIGNTYLYPTIIMASSCDRRSYIYRLFEQNVQRNTSFDVMQWGSYIADGSGLYTNSNIAFASTSRSYQPSYMVIDRHTSR